MGIAAHTDSGIFTLIAQQDKPGLELCLPDGRWERPQALPGAFLVNAGDMLRRWTNHRFASALRSASLASISTGWSRIWRSATGRENSGGGRLSLTAKPRRVSACRACFA